MSDRINLENYHAAQQYAQHHSSVPTADTLRRWLSNNKVSIPGRSDTFVAFSPAILELLDHHARGTPIPPPLSRGYMKRTRRRVKPTRRRRARPTKR